MGQMNKRISQWAYLWIGLMILVALSADFLANNRPLVASVDGKISFPVLDTYFGEDAKGIGEATFIGNWYTRKVDWAVWPPVPYDGTSSDLKNARYKSPFAAQNTAPRSRHWLGTDYLGRDLLAGLIHGTRVALLVGFGGVLFALLIGVPAGGAAGFFGDTGLSSSRGSIAAIFVGLVAGPVYTVVALIPYFRLDSFIAQLLLSLLSAIVLSGLLYSLSRLIPYFQKKIFFPVDTLMLQGVEVFINIPAAVFLIAVVSFVDRPTIWVVVTVVGILGWTSVARFLRAELMRIRSLPYIEAAYGSNIPKWRILFLHALPNAIGPLTVVASFMVGSGILLEAFLSFLGIGVPTDIATWGGLLRRSRENPYAWWLAVFPGIFLTLTLLSVQLIGEDRR